MKNSLFNTIKKTNSMTVFIACCLMPTGFMAMNAHCAVAENSVAAESTEGATASAAPEEKTSRVRRTPTMRPIIYSRLEEIQKLADNKNHQQALEKLSALQKMQRNSYEQAMTWSMQAYVYFNKENYNEAIKAYEQILGIANIPESLEENTQYSLAKLYLLQEKYSPSLKALNAWFEMTAKPNAQAYIMRAQIYYQLNQFKKALPDIKQAVDLSQETGMKIPENWLLLERAVYYQNKDFKSMERCLQDLIALYPKKQYWLQLASVYNELNQPLKEVAIMEMMYEQGALETETEIIGLAQAMLGNNSPYKAANVLLQSLKNGKVKESTKVLTLLGDSFMLAKEYDQAIIMMEKAAKSSNLAKDYYKVAQITADRQRWPQALENIDKALSLGGLNDVHNAYVLKGMVLFNMEKFGAAKAEFEKAKGFAQTKAAAEQWLSYIEGEEQRRAYMAGNE